MNNATRQIAVSLTQEELETVLRLVGTALRDQHFSTAGHDRVRTIGEKVLSALYQIGEGFDD